MFELLPFSVVEKTQRLLPRARPVRCRPQLGSRPAGLISHVVPSPCRGDRNEVSSWETVCQNVGVTSSLKGRRQTWRKMPITATTPSCSPCSETVHRGEGPWGPPGGHGGCCTSIVPGSSLLPKGVTHEENYVTRFTLLPFNVEHVEQCIGL